MSVEINSNTLVSQYFTHSLQAEWAIDLVQSTIENTLYIRMNVHVYMQHTAG